MFTSLVYNINSPETRRYPMWIRLRNNLPLVWWLWSTTWE